MPIFPTTLETTVGKLLAFLRWGHQSALPITTRSQEVRRLVMRLLETLQARWSKTLVGSVAQ